MGAMFRAVGALPMKELRPWLSASTPDEAVRALAHVTAQAASAGPVLPEVLGLLSHPATCAAAARAVRAIANAAKLSGGGDVVALARDAADPRVQRSAASVLGCFEDWADVPRREVIAVLER